MLFEDWFLLHTVSLFFYRFFSFVSSLSLSLQIPSVKIKKHRVFDGREEKEVVNFGRKWKGLKSNNILEKHESIGSGYTRQFESNWLATDAVAERYKTTASKQQFLDIEI
ncbi:hypothetical protein VNO77_44365 [Canavalia gladiata]|uniref:Uncharacterized protein n=1 Tax=Canavalia gladiata TaxID=3824 RepID=A0AAN9PQA8_CANGL